jgi:flagellar hook assembly protein FlgD
MFTTQMAQLNPQLAKLNLGSSLASMGWMPQLQSLQRSGIGGVPTSSADTQLSTPAAKADFLTFGQKP